MTRRKIIYSVLLGISATALASIGPKLKTVADEIQKDQRHNTLTLIGHAELSQDTQLLTADRIIVNTESGDVLALGNCRYADEKSSAMGDRLQYRIVDGEWHRRD